MELKYAYRKQQYVRIGKLGGKGCGDCPRFPSACSSAMEFIAAYEIYTLLQRLW